MLHNSFIPGLLQRAVLSHRVFLLVCPAPDKGLMSKFLTCEFIFSRSLSIMQCYQFTQLLRKQLYKRNVLVSQDESPVHTNPISEMSHKSKITSELSGKPHFQLDFYQNNWKWNACPLTLWCCPTVHSRGSLFPERQEKEKMFTGKL